MQNLNNNQVILLTLLVSFVTSIATGIVTVTLMDQAPTGVTQVINRVVEKTVETVVPKGIKETIIEERVIVNQEEVIVGTIQNTRVSFVTIRKKINENEIVKEGDEKTKKMGDIVTRGIMVTNDGKIIAESKKLLDEEYTIVTSDGQSMDYKVVKKIESGLSALIPKDKISEGKIIMFMPLSEKKISLGQTAILLWSDKINIGFVASLVKDAEDGSILVVETNINNKDSEGMSVLVNTEKEVIGVYIDSLFIPVSDIKDLLKSEKEVNDSGAINMNSLVSS
jgi:hypothetical protein